VRSLALRLSIVRELAKRDVPLEELEKILRENMTERDIEKLKIMIADLIHVEDRRVTLSGEGRLLLRLISEK